MKLPEKTRMMAHLKHLMFNDCVAMSYCECNHNASDRCTTWEIWYDDIRQENFEDRYVLVRALYQRKYRDFEPGYYKDVADIERYASEHANNCMDYIKWREKGENFPGKPVDPPSADLDDEEFIKMLERGMS
jgi:hypothetical protein